MIKTQRKISRSEEKAIEKIDELCPLVDPTQKGQTKSYTDEEVMEEIYDFNKNNEHWIIIYSMGVRGLLERIDAIEQKHYTPNTEANGDFGLLIMNGKMFGTSVFTLKKTRMPKEKLRDELKNCYFQGNFVVPIAANKATMELIKEIKTSFKEIEKIRNENL